MSLKLTKAEEMLHQMVCNFDLNEVKPYDSLIDINKGYPKELWDKLINTEFLGLMFTKEYGGEGFGVVVEAQTIFDILKYSYIGDSKEFLEELLKIIQ